METRSTSASSTLAQDTTVVSLRVKEKKKKRKKRVGDMYWVWRVCDGMYVVGGLCVPTPGRMYRWRRWGVLALVLGKSRVNSWQFGRSATKGAWKGHCFQVKGGRKISSVREVHILNRGGALDKVH